MGKFKYDCSGWVTRNDVLCKDGRVLRHGAFSHQNHTVVPVCYDHVHNDINQVLGHAYLVDQPEGVYGYISFNNTPSGQNAKETVMHGDIDSFSIWANGLTHAGNSVVHGDIKEVSIVLSGANPEAHIDDYVSHDDLTEDMFFVATANDYMIDISHGDIDEGEDYGVDYDDYDGDDDAGEGEYLSDEEMEELANELIEAGEGEGDEDYDEDYSDDLQHSDVMTLDEFNAAIDSMSPEQFDAMAEVVQAAVDDAVDELATLGHSDMEEYGMNVFEQYGNGMAPDQAILSHDDITAIIEDGRRCGSLKKSFFAHMENMGFDTKDDMNAVLAHDGLTNGTPGVDYGISNIEMLFPEYKNINTPPEFIKRDTEWVSRVMSGVKRLPFSRIKSMFADITGDQARARGYQKGYKKIEEVFGLLQRTTDPQTVYKKQKLDKDDIRDITDFDVVRWLKNEMRLMLDEEIARAILIGDGREVNEADKIKQEHIRSIYNEEKLFAFSVPVTVSANASDDAKAKSVIRAAVKGRVDYKGSGNPVLFTTENWLTDMLLIEDGIGHRLYKTEEELRTALRVSAIVTVEVMEGAKRTIEVTDDEGNVTGNKTYDLIGIVVNLNDYAVGTDKGGGVEFFDDFDIDFNQEKYLIETRLSGALTKPKSAMIIEMETVDDSSTQG